MNTETFMNSQVSFEVLRTQTELFLSFLLSKRERFLLQILCRIYYWLLQCTHSDSRSTRKEISRRLITNDRFSRRRTKTLNKQGSEMKGRKERKRETERAKFSLHKSFKGTKLSIWTFCQRETGGIMFCRRKRETWVSQLKHLMPLMENPLNFPPSNNMIHQMQHFMQVDFVREEYERTSEVSFFFLSLVRQDFLFNPISSAFTLLYLQVNSPCVPDTVTLTSITLFLL